MIGPTIINATVEELTATCSGVSCDIQSDQPEECCKISWNEWYEWQGCSVTCGPGYQVRWRLHNNVSEGPFEAQVRKCAHKLSVDCNSEEQTVWSESDTSRLLVFAVILLLVYTVILALLRWQGNHYGNMWAIENQNTQKASVDATMGQLTPSQLIIHREMMKNLKILHAQLAGQPSNDDHEKIREMEDLKLNLDVLGLG